jgi:hypothetical protein
MSREAASVGAETLVTSRWVESARAIHAAALAFSLGQPRAGDLLGEQ